MNIIEIVIVTFLLMGFSVLGIAFWATWYPKILCQKNKSDDSGFDACIKYKKHPGTHMTVNGEKFTTRQVSISEQSE